MTPLVTEERRHDPQISLAVITHMEERLTAHAKQMSEKFDSHTRDEMDRFDEIANKYAEVLALIAQNNIASNERHKSLLESVDNHMRKTESIYECIAEAFPADKKGKPDFAGHANAHDKWIENAKDTKQLIEYVKRVVLAAVGTALVSWVTLLVWNGVLHGPAK